ncbi:MAG: sensor domain-containing diguanylate cyclase [Planctomycetota bacterium]
MAETLEILYVGGHLLEAVDEVAPHGGVIHGVDDVYAGIAALKRTAVQAAVVEYEALGEEADKALAALRRAANGRPLFVSLTPDEWELARARRQLEPEDILVRPYYPDVLWRRVTSAARPPVEAYVGLLSTDIKKLEAQMQDLRLLTRFTHDLTTLAEQIVEVARKRVRGERVSLFLKTPGTKSMRILHSIGMSDEEARAAEIRMGEGVAGEVAASRESVLVQDAGRDGPAAKQEYKSRSYMIVPMIFQGEMMGLLCVTERMEPEPFTDQDLRYLNAFADVAAQTLHNALQYQAVDKLATIDELTGLFNRRYFNRALQQEIERARRYKHDLTLAMIDIDHFKRFNDANGHQDGDRALAIVARILQDSFREADMVVRYGGEEFVVLMPETSRLPGNGVDFVDRARRKVEAENLVYEWRGTTCRVTISGGVATFPNQADTAEELVRRADLAQFEAKKAGRNRIKGA